ncbi:16844_t:CDS:2, partial [Gigaspora rosea]
MNNRSNNKDNNNNATMESSQNIALFLQLLSNPALLQQTLAAVSQNSHPTTAPTSSEPVQPLPALSNAIAGVVNISFPRGSAQNPITKEEWNQWRRTKKPEEDWKDFLHLSHDTYWTYRAKTCVTVGDFVLQKISENIIGNWVETERKNKIKEAHAQGIAPPPKRKNVIPPTSRFKKKTSTQSLMTSSDITEIDDEIDDRSIASNESNETDFFSRYDSITSTNIDTSELSTVTSHAKRSKSSKIPVKLSATSSNVIEVNSTEVNDDSNASTISSRVMQPSRPSRIPVRLSSKGSNVINVDSSDINDNNGASELSPTTSYIKKPSGSSRISARLAAKSTNANEVNNSASELSTVTPRAMKSSRSSTQLSTSSNKSEVGDNINTKLLNQP